MVTADPPPRDSELPRRIQDLARQLFNAGKDHSAYTPIIEQVLAAGDNYDIEVQNLVCVLKTRFPKKPIPEELQHRLKAAAESSQRKRKEGAYNLATISVIWSPHVVKYYSWDNAASVKTIRYLKEAAEQIPDFENDFIPLINRVIV
jgi:hypothetical protein